MTTRESPVLRIIELLENLGADLTFVDPHVEEFHNHNSNKSYKTTKLTNDLIKKADITLITTDHDKFDAGQFLEYSSLIYDTRNFIKTKSDKVFKL
jgi:UDP-N-acetyl-D-glucosamine dehydrogenase